ncbi:hypothetical protein [Roseovarius salinarum]|uniref:hypothetical protein n=1 Tax=Roseovarius salinarum TaxID=1981892 RepID=UPI000C33DB03|nr:hypothetical protein [Roseovarius salinarum]
MPLHVLIILVAAGIAGIVGLLHLLGLSEPARLADEDAARAAWAAEFPDDPALAVIVSHDRGAALVETQRGRGIVWPVGADTTARYLIGARARRTRSGVRIDLPDFTAPHVHLRLDAREADRWPALLEDTA